MSSPRSPRSPLDKGQVLKITYHDNENDTDTVYIINSTKNGIRCRLANPPEGKKNTFIPCPEEIKATLVQQFGHAFVYGEKSDPSKPKPTKDNKPKIKMNTPKKERVTSPRSPTGPAAVNTIRKRTRKLKPIKGPTYGPSDLEVIDRPSEEIKYFVFITGYIKELQETNKFKKDVEKTASLMPIFTVAALDDIRVYNENIMESGEVDAVNNKMFENEDYYDEEGQFVVENLKPFIIFKTTKPRKSKMYSQIKSITNRLQKYKYANNISTDHIKKIKYHNEFIYITIDSSR